MVWMCCENRLQRNQAEARRKRPGKKKNLAYVTPPRRVHSLLVKNGRRAIEEPTRFWWEFTFYHV